MQALVFTVLATAQAKAAAVDAALGYPKAGLDIGGGIHAPASMTVTLRYADLIPHPTLPQWAYPVDAVTAPRFTAPEIASAVTLDASWTPVAVTASVDSPAT